MPKPGDYVYQVWNGELEQYMFLSEEIVPGATRPTWKIRQLDAALHFTEMPVRVSPGHYYLTALAAYQVYLKSCKEGIETARQGVLEAADHLAYVYTQTAKTESIIKELESGSTTS